MKVVKNQVLKHLFGNFSAMPFFIRFNAKKYEMNI